MASRTRQSHCYPRATVASKSGRPLPMAVGWRVRVSRRLLCLSKCGPGSFSLTWCSSQGSPAQVTWSQPAGAFCGGPWGGVLLPKAAVLTSSCTLETTGSFEEMPMEAGLISFGVHLACGDSKNLWVIWLSSQSWGQLFNLSQLPFTTVIMGFNIQGNYNKPFLICL